MKELKDWITELKTEKPELNDFITKLEGFISDNGFNIAQFERAIDKGLQLKEEEVKKTFIKHVESKEDNN
ncbi:hypothetical protein L0U88_20570 [Flavihumibacter sp. RY-1]|uniref:Uncharacterized protein n=1 Tax=Flavihumibacter fluminis TaxID=2909236 RepID=A0ABS9BP99_9BACT|nr:hypothetical protein [Flavihumibacter fluminis]MCF1717049.1 hypothetical protein [Flavihumibacter fluminis]